MHRRTLTATAVAGCVIVLTACVAHGTPAASAEKSAPPAPAAVVERGRQALGAAGLPADLKLLSSEQVQWSDSSLGCPQPGMMYAQVITSGYVLRFADGETTREVHVTGDAALVCSTQLGTGVPKRATAAYRANDLDKVVEQARADLAVKLNLKVEDVSLRNFEPTTWPDSRLGCGEPVADATPGPVRGFKLILVAGGLYYPYHTDLKRAFPCPPIATE